MAIEVYLANSISNDLAKTISLPCYPKTLATILDEIDTDTCHEYVILETKCFIEGVSSCINKNTSLAELNEAAFLLQQLSPNSFGKVSAFISDRASNMTSLLLYLQSLFSELSRGKVNKEKAGHKHPAFSL